MQRVLSDVLSRSTKKVSLEKIAVMWHSGRRDDKHAVVSTSGLTGSCLSLETMQEQRAETLSIIACPIKLKQANVSKATGQISKVKVQIENIEKIAD